MSEYSALKRKIVLQGEFVIMLKRKCVKESLGKGENVGQRRVKGRMLVMRE